MKHKRYKLISSIIILSAIIASCLKDKGNYTYTPVTDPVIVKGIDTLYLIDVFNTSFRIDPVITTLDGKPIDTSRYTYSWQLDQVINLTYYPHPRPLSTSPSLNITKKDMITTIRRAQRYDKLFDTYTAFFRVTDKASGIFKDTYFKVIFGGISSRGWLLLCDNGDGNSRLDMISAFYNDSLIIDILASTKSSFPINGQPRFIVVDNQARLQPHSSPAPFIGTSQNIAILGGDTLEYKTPEYDLKNHITGFPPSANFSTATFLSDGPLHYLQNNGDLFFVYEFNDNTFEQCNYLDNTKFKASKFVAVNWGLDGETEAIVFNEDTRTFLRTPGQPYCLELPAGTLFNFSANQELRYMEYARRFNGGEVFAILDSTSKINLARFSISGIQSYYKEITAPDIRQAELFSVDDVYGFILYSVGGKLYQYDMIARQAQLIHDYGNSHITFLRSFTDKDDLFNNSFSNVAVATYNDADKSSGTFDLYSSPKIDGSMSLVKSFKHTGKVVDAAYK